MDVILTQHVDKIGNQGAVVHVKSGFARNFLIPRGLALPATDANRKQFEETARQQARKVERAAQQAQDLKQRIEALTLTMSLSAGEGDKPFGSVSAHDVLTGLREQGITVEKSAIELSEPIKAFGTHHISVRLHAQVTAVLNLSVAKAAVKDGDVTR